MMIEVLPLPTLVTCGALAVYFWNLGRVGQARVKYGIDAPAISGHPDFDRVIRVQMNMTEQLPFFLPSLWLFSFLVSAHWAALLGLFWIIGRILFSLGYYKDPGMRGRGFVLSIGCSIVLLCGALVGAVLQLLQ